MWMSKKRNIKVEWNFIYMNEHLQLLSLFVEFSKNNGTSDKHTLEYWDSFSLNKNVIIMWIQVKKIYLFY